MRPRVLLVGNGLVGASAMLAIDALGWDITWVAPSLLTLPSHQDKRSIVVNAVSQRILHNLGVWSSLRDEAAAINNVVVSEQGYFGRCRFSAAEANLAALGYVVPANRLLETLLIRAQQATFNPVHGCVTAWNHETQSVVLSTEQGEETWHGDMIIASDGAMSPLRAMQSLQCKTRNYRQIALASCLECTQPHQGKAFERFTPEGPLALLPRRKQQYGMVWVVSPQQHKRLMAMSHDEWMAQVEKAVGTSCGLLKSSTHPVAYPLALSWMPNVLGPKTIYIGNAAQSLHPAMGQGYNLGLRDATILAEVFSDTSSCVGAAGAMMRYAQRRKQDRQAVMRLSDITVRAFSHRAWPIKWLRLAGLNAIGSVTWPRQCIASISMGKDRPWIGCQEVSE